jgi:hypothetical protein
MQEFEPNRSISTLDERENKRPITTRRNLVDFCLYNKLDVTNIFLRHKNIHKFVLEARGTETDLCKVAVQGLIKAYPLFIHSLIHSRGTESEIYYIIVIEKLRTAKKGKRVLSGGEIDTDHYLL